MNELSTYGLLNALKTAISVREASDTVLLNFEKPASVGPNATAQQREDTCVKRANYGQMYFDQFVTKKGAINSMSNSPLIVYTALSPNCSTRTAKIDKITIHHAAGVGTVESIGNIFAPKSRAASANYGVGNDGRIGLYVPEDKRAWTSSNTANDNRAVTIEVSNSATGGQWPVSDAAYKALIDLCVDICQRNGIEKLIYTGDTTGNLTRHNMFAATACPGPYLQERFPQIAEEVNKRLEDENMTVDRFKELWREMRAELQDNDSSEYSEAARAWAISTGLISGGDTNSNGEPNYMWEDILTREQFVTVLYRFASLMGKV